MAMIQERRESRICWDNAGRTEKPTAWQYLLRIPVLSFVIKHRMCLRSDYHNFLAPTHAKDRRKTKTLDMCGHERIG